MIDLPANDIVEEFTKRAENYLRARKESGALDPRDGGPMILVFPRPDDWVPNRESTFEEHQAAGVAHNRLIVEQCYAAAMAGNGEAIRLMNQVALEAYGSAEMLEAMPPKLFWYISKRLNGEIQVKKGGVKASRNQWRDNIIAFIVLDTHMVMTVKLGRLAYISENEAKKIGRYADIPPVTAIVSDALRRIGMNLGGSSIYKVWKSNEGLATWQWLISMKEGDSVGLAEGNQPLWSIENDRVAVELEKLKANRSNHVGRVTFQSSQLRWMDRSRSPQMTD